MAVAAAAPIIARALPAILGAGARAGAAGAAEGAGSSLARGVGKQFLSRSGAAMMSRPRREQPAQQQESRSGAFAYGSAY